MAWLPFQRELNDSYKNDDPRTRNKVFIGHGFNAKASRSWPKDQYKKQPPQHLSWYEFWLQKQVTRKINKIVF